MNASVKFDASGSRAPSALTLTDDSFQVLH